MISSHLYLKDTFNPKNRIDKLPHWARYFVDLGQSLGDSNEEISDYRVIWVVIVPDTRYVSSLLAFGLLSNEFVEDKSESIFEDLSRYPDGTKVSVAGKEGEAPEEGVKFTPTTRTRFNNGINIRFSNSYDVCYNETTVHKLTVIEPASGKSELSKVRSYLGLDNPKSKFIDDFKCVFVTTNKKQLEEELFENIWGIQMPSSSGDWSYIQEFNLQSIVKVSSNKTKLESFSLSTIDVARSKRKISLDDENPKWILFTDSSSYIKKWNNPDYKNKNWVIVISPKEPRYFDAKNLIEGHAISKSEVRNLTELSPPMGIQVLQLHERRNEF
jgi:hypothetical protein